jgi:DUF2934 family protein
MKNPKLSRSNPTDAEIQHAAYLLWLEAGRPEGRDLEHWLAAKELLCHHHGRAPKPRRRPPVAVVR